MFLPEAKPYSSENKLNISIIFVMFVRVDRLD